MLLWVEWVVGGGVVVRGTCGSRVVVRIPWDYFKYCKSGHFREAVVLGFLMKSRIRELSISMKGSAHNNIFLRFLNSRICLCEN